MANQSIEITLQDAVTDEENIDLRLELNSDDNQGRTAFYDSDTVFLRFHSSSTKAYSVTASIGFASKSAPNIGFSHTENITFSNSNEASLSYLPKIILSNQWVGKSLGNVSFIGKTARIPNKGTGVLKVSYNSAYDLIQHSIGRIFEPVKAIISAEQGNAVASCEIDYQPRNAVSINSSGQSTVQIGSKTPYTLLVMDYSTGQEVQGAAVYLNGCYMGFTDSKGKIYLGELSPGTYYLFVQRDGYFPTRDDGLNNDQFTVA